MMFLQIYKIGHMLHILNLFGRSPFAPLQGHMEKVADSVFLLDPLFRLLRDKELPKVGPLARQISEFEHGADQMKSDIRNHLPNSLFLTIERSTFLEILQLQDSIADKAEDIAVLATITQLEFHPHFQELFFKFLDKNIECYLEARKIIQELNELLESSFGGLEAEKVKTICDAVAFLEHEADVIQRDLLRGLFLAEKDLSPGVFGLWQKIFEATGSISNLSEKLADCVRTTLDLK